MLQNMYVHSILSKIFLVFCSFLNTVIINRYLGLDDRGEYGYFINVVNILSVFIGFAISSSFPYFRERYGDNALFPILKIIHAQMALYTILLLVIWGVVGFNLYFIFMLSAVVVQYSSQLDFLAIVVDVRKRNRLVGATALVYTLALLSIYFWTDDELYVIISVFVCFSVLKIFFYIFRFDFLYTKGMSVPFFDVFKISGFSMLAALVGMLNYNADVLILQKYVSFSEIGLYSAAVALASMFWVIPDAFKEVLIGKLRNGRGVTDLVYGIQINILLGVAILFCFYYLGEFFIVFFYGEEYGPSYGISFILLLGVTPMIFFKFIGSYYLFLGKQIVVFLVSFLSMLINILLNFLLVPNHGVEGAAIASVISYLFVGVIMAIVFYIDNPEVFKKLFRVSAESFKIFK